MEQIPAICSVIKPIFVMYHTIIRLFIAFLFVAGAFHSGNSSSIDCPLPPPDSLHVTGITPTSISLAWAPVLPPSYYVNYKVRFYDMTTSTQLADEFTVLTYHTRTGLSPGHEYRITVSASHCNEEYGAESDPIFCRTTDIVIDYIVQNSCTPERFDEPDAGENATIQLIAANPLIQTVQVVRLQVQSGNSMVDYTLWADCYGTPHYYQIESINVVRDPPGIGHTQIIDFDFATGGNFFTITPVNSVNPPPGGPGGQLVTFVNIAYEADCFVSFCSGNSGTNDCYEGSGPREARVINATGKQNGLTTLSLSAMPNPSSGSFQLEYDLPAESAAFFTLSGCTGQVLRYFEPPGILQAGTHTTNLQTDDLPPGLYFLTLQTNTERRAITLIKQ